MAGSIVSKAGSAGTEEGVVYGRRSTDRQETSLPEQAAWAIATAAREGIPIAAEFTDDAISGSDIGGRDGLQDLIRFVEGRAKTRPIRVVICWAIDRFSRSDTLATFAVLARLRDAGVRRVVTNSRTFNLHDKIDKTLLAIEQDFTSNGFVKKLSENVTRSLVSRAKEGKWLGRIPHGYRIGDDGRLALGDPAKAKDVQWLFESYATTSASLRELARKLKERGAPAPTQAGWSRYTVYHILRNEAYIGTFRWNDTHQGRHYRVKAGQITEVRPEDVSRPGCRGWGKNATEDVIVLHDHHPALVSRALFKAVAKKLAHNRGRRTTPTRGRVWPLSGLVHCGNCGSRMTGRIDYANDRRDRYEVLHCAGAATQGCGTCRTNRVLHERVLSETAALIRERLTDPDHLAELKAELDDLAASQDTDTAADRERITATLAELNRKLDQGAEALLTCPASVRARAAAKLSQWEQERTTLAEQLAGLEAAAEQQDTTAARAAAAFDDWTHLEDVVASGDPEAVRDVFAAVVDSIRLTFAHGRQLKAGRRTHLERIDVDLLPELAHLLSSAGRRRRRSWAGRRGQG